MKEATYRLLVKGLVQGIGFRPFIYRLAGEFRLMGRVENRNDGVSIRVNGTEKKIAQFRDAILLGAPEASSIEQVEIEDLTEDYNDEEGPPENGGRTKTESL